MLRAAAALVGHVDIATDAGPVPRFQLPEMVEKDRPAVRFRGGKTPCSFRSVAIVRAISRRHTL